MKNILIFLILTLSFLVPGKGFASDLCGIQPPSPFGVFSTMIANTPGKGKAAVAFSIEKAGSPDFYRLSTHLAQGIGKNLEFDISIPYTDNSESGLEDIAFGLKHMVYAGGRYGPSMAYVLSASVDSGVKGLSTGGRMGAGIALSKRVGPIFGHANAFYFRPGDPDLEDEMKLSAGMDFSAAHNLSVIGEVFGKKSHFSEELDQLEVRLGYRFLAGNDWITSLGAGFDLKEKSPEYRIMASLTLMFPRQEKYIKKMFEEEQ